MTPGRGPYGREGAGHGGDGEHLMRLKRLGIGASGRGGDGGALEMSLRLGAYLMWSLFSCAAYRRGAWVTESVRCGHYSRRKGSRHLSL